MQGRYKVRWVYQSFYVDEQLPTAAGKVDGSDKSEIGFAVGKNT